MLIKHSSLGILDQAVNLKFKQGLEEAPAPIWNKFTMEVPSSTQTEIYPWLQSLPGMRQWVGPRQVNNLASAGYSLTNSDYEDTFAIDQNDVEDDKIGLYGPALSMLASETKIHLDILMAAALANGESTVCWDGQNYFDTDHPRDWTNPGANQFSNNWTGAGSGATTFTAANVAALYVKFAAFTKSNGEPMGLVPDTVIIPAALTFDAARIFNTQSTAAASMPGGGSAGVQQDNIIKGLLNVVINPYLDAHNTSDWYMGICNRPVKPLLLQMRKKADQLVRKDQPTDEGVFWDRKINYGVHGRYAAGYSFPQFMIKAGA